jgi:hypothetical protein
MKTIQEISEICKNIGLRNYTINLDGTVDVQGGVDLRRYRMSKLPLEFGRVSEYFSCADMGLTTLEGCPKEVGRDFHCSHNKINTLEGCPKEIDGDFFCFHNPNLTSLEGLEDTINRGNLYFLHCYNLYCLDGFPIDFKGSKSNLKWQFDCEYTPIYPIYERYIKDTHFEGSNRLAQAINFFNELRVIEEYNDGWRIHYRSFLEYLKRYKEFGKPTKEELQALVGNYYIVK